MFQTVSKRLPHPSKSDIPETEVRVELQTTDRFQNQRRAIKKKQKILSNNLNYPEHQGLNLRQVTKLYRKRKGIVNNLKEKREQKYDHNWIIYKAQDISEENDKVRDGFKLENIQYFPLLNDRSQSIEYFPLLSQVLNDETIQPIRIDNKSLANDVQREFEMEEKKLNEEMLSGEQTIFMINQEKSLSRDDMLPTNQKNEIKVTGEFDLQNPQKKLVAANDDKVNIHQNDEEVLEMSQGRIEQFMKENHIKRAVNDRTSELENNVASMKQPVFCQKEKRAEDDNKHMKNVQVEHIHHYHHYYHNEDQQDRLHEGKINSHEGQEWNGSDRLYQDERPPLIDLNQLMNPMNYSSKYVGITKIAAEDFFQIETNNFFKKENIYFSNENMYDIPKTNEDSIDMKNEQTVVETFNYSERGHIESIKSPLRKNGEVLTKPKEIYDLKNNISEYKNSNLKSDLFVEVEQQAQILENELLFATGEMSIIEKRLDEDYEQTVKDITEEYNKKRKNINTMLIGHNTLNVKLISSSNRQEEMNSNIYSNIGNFFEENKKPIINNTGKGSKAISTNSGKTRLQCKRDAAQRKVMKSEKNLERTVYTKSEKGQKNHRIHVSDSQAVLVAQQELNEAKTLMGEIDSLINEIQIQKASP